MLTLDSFSFYLTQLYFRSDLVEFESKDTQGTCCPLTIEVPEKVADKTDRFLVRKLTDSSREN